MKNKICKLLQYIFLFLFGGILYYFIEIIYRKIFNSAPSHYSMIIVGGLLFIIIGLINEVKLLKKMPLIQQMILSTIIITAVEYVAGLIINVYLDLNVWSYSNLPFNLHGQICLLYSTIWFFFSIVPILVDDFIREKVFGEEHQSYKLF